MKESYYKGLLGLLILFLFFFRWFYISYGPLDLSPDEAHYWEWSRQLDISYYSKGPVIAYIIAIFAGIGGNSEISVRIGAVLISLVLTILLFHFSRDILRSDRMAFFVAAIPHVTPLFSAGSILMTTDSPFLLFWMLSIYFLYRAIFYKNKDSWLWAGLFSGLGMLSKYTMALIYPSILLYLLFSRADRPWLKRLEPYKALFLSILFSIPIILWNYQHDWIGIRHVIGQTHIEEGIKISIKELFEFIGSQAGVLTPFIFLGILYAMIIVLLNVFKEKREWLFLFMTSVPVFAFFLIKSIQGKVEANWAAPSYVTGIPLMIAVMDMAYKGKDEKGRMRMKWLFFVSIFVAIVITTIAHYPNMMRYVGIYLPPKKDPTTRLVGWADLGKEVGSIYENMEGKWFILSDRYQISSELAFYIPGNPVVYNINIGRRMNQYDIWGGLDNLRNWNAVYVKWDRGISKEMEFFDKCKETPPVLIKRGRIVVRKFYIYLCYSFKGTSPVKEIRY